jgi:hypothetical protein
MVQMVQMRRQASAPRNLVYLNQFMSNGADGADNLRPVSLTI